MTCPACGGSNCNTFLSLGRVPVHVNVLATSAIEAKSAPKGDIDLAFCEDCAHVFNSAFQTEATQYPTNYEASLFHSGFYRAYAEKSAKFLIERFSLRDKTIIEIGCGQGEFLSLLCRLSSNRAFGYDPGLRQERVVRENGIELRRARFERSQVDHDCDLIICRQVLEHLESPYDLLETISQALEAQPRVALFFEVPNALYTFEQMGIWDIIYEHCSYFTPHSLARLFSRTGFKEGEVKTVFGGQFLAVTVSKSADTGFNLADRAYGPLIEGFRRSFEEKISYWRDRLWRDQAEGKKTAIWGVGSKGVTFLNLMEGVCTVHSCVDINPNKLGRFTPGSGHEIVAPIMLREDPPDQVLIMNNNYRPEIEASLKNLGLSPELKFV